MISNHIAHNVLFTSHNTSDGEIAACILALYALEKTLWNSCCPLLALHVGNCSPLPGNPHKCSSDSGNLKIFVMVSCGEHGHIEHHKLLA